MQKICLRGKEIETSYKTNTSGYLTIVEKLEGGKFRVVFDDTGYATVASMVNIRAGKVKDHTLEYVSDTTYPNTILETNKSGKCIVLEKTGKSCIVQFLDTGFTKKALIDNVNAGKIRDPYAKTFFGVAYLGEVDAKPKYYNAALQLWSNMLKRCYSETDKKGYFGKGISVDSRWLCFNNFLIDLPKLENFELWLKGQSSNSEKYNLDKDYKVKNNKVYSRETCIFITEFLNKSLGGSNRHKQKIKLD